MNIDIVVTRHKTLVEWLRQNGYIDDNVSIIEQASIEDVKDKNVVGILPLWLAAEANTVTEVSMPLLPLDARKRVNGGDFSVEEMNDWGAHIRVYRVREEQ